MSISKLKIIFEKQENAEKFSTGPTFARPGPTLFRVVNTAVKFVIKSKLSTEISSTDTLKITK